MILEPHGTNATEQSKAERKVDRLLRFTRGGNRTVLVPCFAALPLEKPRIMRAVTRQLEQLAAVNDGCLIEFASALHLRAHNTAAARGVANGITSAANLLLQSRHRRETAELLRFALALYPAQPRVKRQLAGVLASMGERPEAVAILLALLFSNPANVSAATLLVRLVDASQMTEIGKKIGPSAVAHAEANPALTAKVCSSAHKADVLR